MDISDFNRKLSVFIADARALERTDRKRANAMWLKICEFAIEYSKQKNVDRTLRLRIWKQVDRIIQKVKGEEISSSIPSSPEPSDTEEKSIPFEVDFGFDLPSVPKGEDEESLEKTDSVSFKSSSPTDGDSTPIDEEKQLFQEAISKAPVEDESKQDVNNFVERIKRMEEELRQMPDIFREIKPDEYTPDKSIIPSSAPPPSISPEKPTSLEAGNSLDIEPVERPDTIDPYKGTKESTEIKDPFGPDAQDSVDKEVNISKDSDKHCYACGAPIREKDTVCKKCGAEL
jgi:hypothetical protein